MRPVTDDERRAFAQSVESAFGIVNTEEELDVWARATEASRSLAVFDGGEIVANAGAWSMELTLPGNVSIPVAGVTAVGVSPTHRRQGLLTRMMARQLDDCLSWGEPVAILTASESVIYGRFGYGWATSLVDAEVDADRGAFAIPTKADGRMRRIDKEAALKIAPGLHEHARRATPGDVSVIPAFWEMMAADFESQRGGASALFYAAHESAAGDPDGFVAFRYDKKWRNGNPESAAVVVDLFGTTPDVEAALFRYLLDLDLVATVRFNNRPVEDHLRFRMADPRRYAVQGVVDHLWVRLVDVEAALPLRRYTTDGTVVIEVVDHFRPQNNGRYLLEGGSDGAICVRTTKDDADIRVPVDGLGRAYLGGKSFASLAQEGRAEEVRPGGLRRADAMFLSDAPPFCRSGF